MSATIVLGSIQSPCPSVLLGGALLRAEEVEHGVVARAQPEGLEGLREDLRGPGAEPADEEGVVVEEDAGPLGMRRRWAHRASTVAGPPARAVGPAAGRGAEG